MSTISTISQFTASVVSHPIVKYPLYTAKTVAFALGGIILIKELGAKLKSELIENISDRAIDAVDDWSDCKLSKAKKVQNFALGAFACSCSSIAISLTCNLAAKQFTSLSLLKTGLYGMAAQGAVVTGTLFSFGFFDD